MEFDKFDLIIVGAGPSGCVIAERAARDMAWKCLVIEKRPHVAGNCHDFIHPEGLLLHRYGPHCFRTSKESLVRYLGSFTGWIPGNQRVRAFYKGRLFPIPINLTTLEQFFGRTLTEESARKAVYFCGRLATYSYLDMDQTVENALQLYQVIKGRNAHAGALGRGACL